MSTTPGAEGWLDPPNRQARHDCDLPDVTDVDAGRRWRCGVCGQLHRVEIGIGAEQGTAFLVRVQG